MAFGQQAGPPASSKQVQELLSLLHDAGHTDFRDARGPMGFTQRQAGGKFTRDEADAFIEQLQAEAEASEAVDAGDADAGGAGDAGVQAARPVKPVPKAAAAVSAAGRLSTTEQALRRMPAERLAAELQRRGWVVMEP